MDSTAILEAGKSHWQQAFAIIQQNPSPTNGEMATAVVRHLDQLLTLLLAELKSLPENTIGALLDYMFTNNVLEKVTLWMLLVSDDEGTMDLQVQCAKSMLRMYDSLISQSQQRLIVHKPVLNPMLQLLTDCDRLIQYCNKDKDLEHSFVLLLNQICVKITDNTGDSETPLLDFFFFDDRAIGESDLNPKPTFLVFSFLIPHLYDPGSVGQLAKDASLLILAVSRQTDSVARFIASHTNFCPVLATGLSALFSSLPRNLHLTSEDWHQITKRDIVENLELHHFYAALEFCNAVVQVAHPIVVDQLLDFVYNGFMLNVMGAALLDNSDDELISATAYLDLFFRTVTEVPFMKILMRFVLSEQQDGNGISLMASLITRISRSSQISLVTISLFETILGLHCEDFMFDLVLRYLIPGTHLLINPKSYDSDCHLRLTKSSTKFLATVPRCCSTVCREGEDPLVGGNEANLGFFDAKMTAERFPDENKIEEHVSLVVCQPEHSAYFEYLLESRQNIEIAKDACKCWAAPYDGENPSPTIFRRQQNFSDRSSSGSVEDLVSGKEKDRKLSNDVAFSRNVHYRKSRTNRYYSNRRPSELIRDNLTGQENDKLRDLALGESNFATEIDNLVHNQESTVPNKDDTHKPPMLKNGRRTLSESLSDQSSQPTTPHLDATQHSQMTSSMPVDYFKLSYNDDDGVTSSSSHASQSAKPTVSDSDVEPTGRSMFLLRGWSQINDLSLFIDVLGRVKAKSDDRRRPLAELAGYVTGVYNVLHRNDVNADDLDSQALIESKDSGFEQTDAMADDDKENSLSQVGSCQNLLITRRHLRCGSFSTPDLGPFLTVLIHKLDNLFQNAPCVNLHLTGLLARLASYPQRLLVSFLLDCDLVFQPSVRSLYQVLSSLRQKADNFACQEENFYAFYAECKLQFETKARNFYAIKRTSLVSMKEKAREIPKKNTKMTFASLFSKETKQERQMSLEKSPIRDELINRYSQKSINYVCNIIILEEFAREVASLAQEQSIK